MNIVNQIIEQLSQKGGGLYAGEVITELEHALQCAHLARTSGASLGLVIAALLHDYGHLLHDLPEDFTARGLDDHHETRGAKLLEQHYPPSVCDPIRLHVAAKRYLCTKKADYLEGLSDTSRGSLELQGGLMSADEIEQFESEPYYREAVELRLWDDLAKIPNAQVPPLESYRSLLEQCLTVEEVIL